MLYRLRKFFVLVLVIVLVSVSYTAGYLHGHGNLQFEKNFKAKIVNRELKKPQELDFSLFWQVLARLEDKFVGEVDRQKAIYGAIEGLILSTKDPYTVFLAPGPAKKFLDDLNGEFEGIGTEIAIRDNILTIISPLEGTPAALAGLKAKDRILKIDGQETSVLTLSEAVEKIRGQAGTEVALAIFREGQKEPFEVKVKRSKIKVRSARWTVRNDGLVNLRLSQFNEDTARLVGELAKELASQPIKGVVLDVRNNPGGLLESSIEVASYFLEPGLVVVHQQNKAGEIQEFLSHSVPRSNLTKMPIVVLINGGSASASEILAGALADHQRAKLVGEKSFGKGSVQDFHEFKGGSSLRITIAKWLTPNKSQITNQGINPTIEVKITEEDEKAGRDPQLDKAVELLLTSQ